MVGIVIGGYYGMRNYGDDLFGVVAAAAAKRYWRNNEIAVLAPSIVGVDARFIVPSWFPQGLYSSSGVLGRVSRFGFLASSLVGCDRFVFCGGSLFSSSSSGVRNFLSKTNHDKRFSAVGISIGPFDSRESERSVKEFLKRFEYISVRDSASYDFALSFGLDCPVVNAVDLAGMVPKLFPVDKKKCVVGVREGRVLGFSPCNIPGDPVRARAYCDDFVVAALKLRSTFDFRVVILNLSSHDEFGDRYLCEYVEKELASKGLSVEFCDYASIGVLATWKLISSFDAYLSVRLHGALSAYLCEVPFALYEYHSKCSDFLVDIKKDDSFRLSGEVAGFCSENATERVIAGLLLGEEVRPLAVDAYSSRAALNFSAAPWADVE